MRISACVLFANRGTLRHCGRPMASRDGRDRRGAGLNAGHSVECARSAARSEEGSRRSRASPTCGCLGVVMCA
jgi:hypothetical protein